jgi:hypothetical protein
VQVCPIGQWTAPHRHEQTALTNRFRGPKVTNETTRRSDPAGEATRRWYRDPAWIAAIATVAAVLIGLLGHFTFHVGPDTSAEHSPGVQNVYNIPLARAEQILRTQGYSTLQVDPVCSNSVANGNVREVIVTNGAKQIADEVDVVDENGTTDARVAPGTPLTIKVSDGQTCPSS